jgi:hypothetical protein
MCETAADVVRFFEENHPEVLRAGTIGYVALIKNHEAHIEITPLPLAELKEKAETTPINTAFALSFGRALGDFGYIPGAAKPYANNNSVLKILKEGGLLPFQLGPRARSLSAGAADLQSRSGCLVCVCGPDGCGCYCDYCP